MTTRRRIVVFHRVTADGYFAGSDDNLDWIVPDAELDRSVGDAIAASGPGESTILFGRRTYEQFESFWPLVLDDSPDAAGPSRRREESGDASDGEHAERCHQDRVFSHPAGRGVAQRIAAS